MIDINNSQSYDTQTFNEIYHEKAQSDVLSAIASGIAPASQSQNVLRQYLDTASQAARELADPVAFLQTKYPGERLWRFVLTHPDLDHMRGIKRLHECVGFDNFWDTAHTKPTPSYRSDNDRFDWEFYQKLRSGALYTKILNYTRGASEFAFGLEANGHQGCDNIEVLSPTPALVNACNSAQKSNDLSLVLRVHHCSRSILLPGDAENEAWDAMVAHYGKNLKSDFLKAPHHGRDSAYHLGAVKLISPLITFVSVGRKPDTDASSKYRQQCHRVASTRYHGNIELLILDDGRIEWTVQRNPG